MQSQRKKALKETSTRLDAELGYMADWEIEQRHGWDEVRLQLHRLQDSGLMFLFHSSVQRDEFNWPTGSAGGNGWQDRDTDAMTQMDPVAVT
jgi:hypothetical protein